MDKHFTATVYCIEDSKVLLIYHRKMSKWLPPGGHLNPNETPPEAAKREMFEETGYEIEFIPQENVWINRWNAKSIVRPFMCLLEEIPEHNGTPAHQHMDMIFLARPVAGTMRENDSETSGIRWFSLDEVHQLEPDVEIFEETVQAISCVLSLEPTLAC